MSVGFFRLISAVKSVSLFQNWKLFIIPVFVFLVGCDDKAKTEEVPTRPVRTLAVDNPVGGVLIKHTGEIRPHEESQLSFRIDGRILSRPVDVGDKLKAGQTIATLEPRNNENQVRSAQCAGRTGRCRFFRASGCSQFQKATIIAQNRCYRAGSG